MIRESLSPPTLTWIFTLIEICSPVVVALYTALPCIIGIDLKNSDQAIWVSYELIFSFLPPIFLLSIIFISFNLLPLWRKQNKLSLRIALVLTGLLSILSVPIAGLSPLYAHMSAAGICFGLIGALAFFGPSNWVYYVSVMSVVFAILISIRVYNEVRAA